MRTFAVVLGALAAVAAVMRSPLYKRAIVRLVKAIVG